MHNSSIPEQSLRKIRKPRGAGKAMISKPANATKRAPNNAEWYDSSLTDLLEEQSTASANPALDLAAYVPKEIGPIGADHQTALPRIAGNARLTCLIDEALRQ